MSTVSAALGLDSKGGGDGSGALKAYLRWIKGEEAQQELDTARAKEQAATASSYRRNQLLDRTGFSGTALVGVGLPMTDASLAAHIATLDPNSEEAKTYQDQIAAEQLQNIKAEDIISGKTYELQDQFREFTDKLSGGLDSGKLQALLDQANELAAANPNFDATDYLNAIQQKLDSRKQREDERARMLLVANQPTDNSGA